MNFKNIMYIIQKGKNSDKSSVLSTRDTILKLFCNNKIWRDTKGNRKLMFLREEKKKGGGASFNKNARRALKEFKKFTVV